MGWKMSAVFAVVSFFGMGSLIYLLLHKDKKNEDVSLYKTSKATVVEVKIPMHSVGSVIGKGGNTIKEIETKSNTTIKIVSDPASADFKICVIRGTPESALYAECLIQEIISYQPHIETFEMYVPSIACGRIIGKRGNNIRMIQKSSKAMLSLESFPGAPEIPERKLTIKGTPEQISRAKILVEQKLEDEKIFRGEVENFVPNGHDHKKSEDLLPAEEKQKEAESYRQNEESIGNEFNDIKVYLSAVESPDRFWLQKVGCWSLDLSELIDEMTYYYSKEENKLLHKLENLKLGQIVAVPISDYGKWSRAEVLEIQIDSDTQEPEILLYNLDFGGTEKCKKEDLYELKTDFLKLKFQAIECMLAKVRPRNSTWSKEATDYLKSLRRCNVCHSHIAKILGYEGRSARTKKEKSLIPCVELYDIQKYEVVNVAEVLVKKGLAVWKDEKEEKKPGEGRKDEGEVGREKSHFSMTEISMSEGR